MICQIARAKRPAKWFSLQGGASGPPTPQLVGWTLAHGPRRFHPMLPPGLSLRTKMLPRSGDLPAKVGAARLASVAGFSAEPGGI
jgi:hypothetical protein